MSIAPEWKTLSTAIISDVLDSLGFTEQVSAPGLVPLEEGDLKVGRARTGLWSKGDSPEGHPYLNLVGFIDSLSVDDFAIFSQQDIPVCSLWGDILSTVAVSKGTVGAVVDGLIRDPLGSKQAGFAIWSRGNTPVDPAGRAYLSATDIKVNCGGVSVEPGTLLFADVDGVVFIPSEVEQEVLDLGLKSLKSEDVALKRLRNGEALADIFADLGTV